jgi:GNAT superfamily N-acetyltransferase
MKATLRLRKIFSFGDIYNQPLYSRLQELDKKVFADAKSEFKPNREWWVIVDKGLIVAYCGSLYIDGVCIFVRAWVHRPYRGNGLQSRMIKTRLKAANFCYRAITYVHPDGISSMNNLVNNGFRFYVPQAKYAGDGFLYFYKDIK